MCGAEKRYIEFLSKVCIGALLVAKNVHGQTEYDPGNLSRFTRYVEKGSYLVLDTWEVYVHGARLPRDYGVRAICLETNQECLLSSSSVLDMTIQNPD